MNQAATLTRYIEDFYCDRFNPAHQYLKIINGEEVDQPLKVFILAENAHLVNPKMSHDAAYLFTLDINETIWPQRAPRGWINTPNGMYTCGHNICTSNGTYHPESYVVVPFESQILALFMAMCTNDKQLDHGISVVNYSAERGVDIINESYKSRKYNLNNFAAIIKAIEQKYAEYSARWPKLPAGVDPARWIVVKKGKGKGAYEEYVELDPAIQVDNEKHQLVLTGAVKNYPVGFSSVEYIRIVDKYGNDNIPNIQGVSIVKDINYDDIAGLL